MKDVIPNDALAISVDLETFKQISETAKFRRKATTEALQALCNYVPENEDNPDLTKYLKFKKAWIVVPPDETVPRLECCISKLTYFPEDVGDGTLELSFHKVKAVNN